MDDGRRIPPGQLVGLTSISETITQRLIEYGPDAFGAPLVSRYPDEENEILPSSAAIGLV